MASAIRKSNIATATKKRRNVQIYLGLGKKKGQNTELLNSVDNWNG